MFLYIYKSVHLCFLSLFLSYVKAGRKIILSICTKIYTELHIFQVFAPIYVSVKWNINGLVSDCQPKYIFEKTQEDSWKKFFFCFVLFCFVFGFVLIGFSEIATHRRPYLDYNIYDVYKTKGIVSWCSSK